MKLARALKMFMGLHELYCKPGHFDQIKSDKRINKNKKG